MMVKIKDIIDYLEQIAPPSYQESYDNSGLITGDASLAVKGVMICLDSTEEVIDEAIAKQCNMVIAHHPIVFKGLKRLTGSNYIERTIIKAIKNDIAIYAIHTNLDNIQEGVNKKLGEKIGLEKLKILAPKADLIKLETFAPPTDTPKVLEALAKAGAGTIGNYSDCSFKSTGTGSFKPNKEANPHIGSADNLEQVAEDKIEVIFPNHLRGKVLAALNNSHPYEEVAYYLYPVSNKNQEIGSGMIGKLPKEMSAEEFLKTLKGKLNLPLIKHTTLCKDKIKKVAICGGSGSFLLNHAKSKGADIFITADYKYHEFFDAEERIIIADIGHYESEVHTKELLYEFLNKKFTNIALHLTAIVTNPILIYN